MKLLAIERATKDNTKNREPQPTVLLAPCRTEELTLRIMRPFTVTNDITSVLHGCSREKVLNLRFRAHKFKSNPNLVQILNNPVELVFFYKYLIYRAPYPYEKHIKSRSNPQKILKSGSFKIQVRGHLWWRCKLL